MAAPDLANTVTGFATILSGLVALALTGLMGRQPWRWVAVYAAVVVTGVPTVLHHADEAAFWPGLADIGTNLLLGWLLIAAAAGDDGSSRAGRWVAALAGAANLAYIAWRLAAGPAARDIYALPLGDFGGFKVGEVLLILNSLAGTGLLYAHHRHTPERARPLLYLLTGIFVVGALLASAGNQEVGGRIWAYHALWHIVGGFGFIVLWAFNHVRFT